MIKLDFWKNINKHRQGSCRFSVVWSHLDPLVINNNLWRWICICQFMSNLNCPNDTTCEYNLRPENDSQDHKKGFRTREGVAPRRVLDSELLFRFLWLRLCTFPTDVSFRIHFLLLLPFPYLLPSQAFLHNHRKVQPMSPNWNRKCARITV